MKRRTVDKLSFLSKIIGIYLHTAGVIDPFACSKFSNCAYLKMNNKGADQTASLLVVCS